MTSGRSAQEQADMAARAADVLEQKAAGARRRSESFAAGAKGEEALAQALAPLTAHGWHFLHDRMMPTGGNIDTVAIGPPGVVVIDAKAWNGRVAMTDTTLKVGNWSQAKALDGVASQAAAVGSGLDDGVAVLAGLAITAQPDLDPGWVGDTFVTGLGHLAEGLEAMEPRLSTAAVERIMRTISETFPPSGSAPAVAQGFRDVETPEVSQMFHRGNRLLYINEWKRSGKRRLYLKTDAGEGLGWKDVFTGEVHLEPSTDHPFAHLVLSAATPSSLVLNKKDVPKVAVEMPAGKLLGRLGKLWVTAVVGQLWSGKGTRRLYCTVANPTEGVFKVGFVDLKTGFIKPEIDGELSDLLGTADRYLGILRDSLPPKPTNAAD